jgi:hypothetical protein
MGNVRVNVTVTASDRHSFCPPRSDTDTMNLSLYSVNAFIILDTEGNRVIAKYYRSKSHPLGESKEFLTLKEQKAFEKGLWQKTKKAGGTCILSFISNTLET